MENKSNNFKNIDNVGKCVDNTSFLLFYNWILGTPTFIKYGMSFPTQVTKSIYFFRYIIRLFAFSLLLFSNNVFSYN